MRFSEYQDHVMELQGGWRTEYMETSTVLFEKRGKWLSYCRRLGGHWGVMGDVHRCVLQEVHGIVCTSIVEKKYMRLLE
jgi:predicted Rossmann-fold nucleotide-binding protein